MLTFNEFKLPLLLGDRVDGQLLSITPSMIDAVQKCDVAFPRSLCLVTEESPRTYMSAVQTIGRCWQQELRYDFPPFTVFEYRKRTSEGRLFEFEKETTNDSNTRSFMWVVGTPRHWQSIGACTFRLRGKYWWLMWVWFHPEYRRAGHLTAAWPLFESMFGVFIPEEPFSPSFLRFLQKQDYGKKLLEHIALKTETQ